MDAAAADDPHAVDASVGGVYGRTEPPSAAVVRQVPNVQIGVNTVVAPPGSGKLFILNQSAARLWQECARRPDENPENALIDCLVSIYGMSDARARAETTQLLQHWRLAGLICASRGGSQSSPDFDWVLPCPPSTCHRSGDWVLELAGHMIALQIEDSALRNKIEPYVAGLRNSDALCHSHDLLLRGCHDDWVLEFNNQAWMRGASLDEAVTAVIGAAIDLACRSEDRLLVVHGAGLALDDSRGVLLIAAGGSGKTTLAAALNVEGLALLSDDVVPIDLEGKLLALRAPICAKSGSWEVLSPLRPDINALPVLSRFGQPVRLLPPVGPPPAPRLSLELMLFPTYRPGSAPSCRPLSAESALQKIVESESVIRNITQQKLESIVRIISTAPAYALSYPDLASGLQLARAAIASLPQA